MELQVIRREVDADNSCLFSSIAYLIDRENFQQDSGLKFRQIIIDYLLSDKFDQSLLDLPKDQYIEFIVDPRNWGGALEVKMFSEIFEKQIVCIDVKTNRADIYGEDKHFEQRIYLLYNGTHYDPLVMNFDSESEPLTDITIFESFDTEIMELMKCLVLNYKDLGDYTDTNYNLECRDCKEKFKTQDDAAQHSINYNHWSYNQIK
jgi:ubiquitin thioesterase OTU1